jgi:hypothetical protein
MSRDQLAQQQHTLRLGNIAQIIHNPGPGTRFPGLLKAPPHGIDPLGLQ